MIQIDLNIPRLDYWFTSWALNHLFSLHLNKTYKKIKKIYVCKNIKNIKLWLWNTFSLYNKLKITMFDCIERRTWKSHSLKVYGQAQPSHPTTHHPLSIPITITLLSKSTSQVTAPPLVPTIQAQSISFLYQYFLKTKKENYYNNYFYYYLFFMILLRCAILSPASGVFPRRTG